jgi:hypothetical protein
MRAFATITGLVGVFGLLAGCAAQVGGEDAASESAELSKSTATFVTLSVPACKRGPCPAYIAEDVNRNTLARSIGNLDFSRTGFTKDTIAKITSAPAGEIVLKAKLGPVQYKTNLPSLIVIDAYRGMPGVTFDSTAVFYQGADFSPPVECFAAPCPEGSTAKLNTTMTSSYDSIDVSGAAESFVSQDWLRAQVAYEHVIVAGTIAAGPKVGTRATRVLTAEQIFVKMPAAPAECPQFKLAACPEGQVRTYTRSADLCELPGECVTPGICAFFLPACADGYTRASWVGGPNACPQYGCDPTFIYGQ